MQYMYTVSLYKSQDTRDLDYGIINSPYMSLGSMDINIKDIDMDGVLYCILENLKLAKTRGAFFDTPIKLSQNSGFLTWQSVV